MRLLRFDAAEYKNQCSPYLGHNPEYLKSPLTFPQFLDFLTKLFQWNCVQSNDL